MKIYDMFQKDIDRQINGVIKVMQTDDENRRQELEEYVITRELRKHFGSFYDHYEQSVALIILRINSALIRCATR